MNGRLIAREALTVHEINAMVALFDAHFADVTRQHFERDLGEKNWVLLLEDEEGCLAGFSTILFYEATSPLAEGAERVSIVYSGDTIVAPQHWNSPALSRSWIHAVLDLHARAGTARLYWLLLTAGFRTYRFLPLFWREFYPRPERVTPTEVQRWIDELATGRFGAQYDSASGIVRFVEPSSLRPELAATPSGRTSNPHVAYFLERNPRYFNGDELVCLTEIAKDNLTRAGWRMVDRLAMEHA